GELLGFVPLQGALDAAIRGGDPEEIRKANEALNAKFPRQAKIVQETRKLGKPSPLQMTFHSKVPSRLGKYAVKYSAAPDPANDCGRRDLTETSSEGALREAMVEH